MDLRLRVLVQLLFFFLNVLAVPHILVSFIKIILQKLEVRVIKVGGSYYDLKNHSLKEKNADSESFQEPKANNRSQDNKKSLYDEKKVSLSLVRRLYY